MYPEQTVGRNKRRAAERIAPTSPGGGDGAMRLRFIAPYAMRRAIVFAMPNYRRAFAPGGCWFFTVNLLDRRRRLLTDHIDALRAATRLTQARHPFTIDAMVVLPDHIHAVWTPPPDDEDFSLLAADQDRLRTGRS